MEKSSKIEPNIQGDEVIRDANSAPINEATENKPIQNLNSNQNESQNQQNKVTDSSSAPKKIQKWQIVEIILFILLGLTFLSNFIFLIFSDGLYGRYLETGSPEVSKPTETLTTNDWQMFEGKAIGMSFKYPSGWFEEDSTWISEKKPNPYWTNTNVVNLADDNRGLTINLIQIDVDGNVNQFNKIKEIEVDKKTTIEVGDLSGVVTKIDEGKVASGEDYIMYYSSAPWLKFEDDASELPPIYVSAKGNDGNIYTLYLTNYNDYGKNVLNALAPTISLSYKPPEWKKHISSAFSFEYPPNGLVSESDLGTNGTKINLTYGDYADFSNTRIYLRGLPYEEADSEFQNWDYWYIDWDNLVRYRKNDPNLPPPDSEVINGNRVIQAEGIGHFDSMYVDLALRYFVFKGGYVVEVMGLRGEEEVVDRIIGSIEINPEVAGEAPDLSEYYSDDYEVIYNEEDGAEPVKEEF